MLIHTFLIVALYGGAVMETTGGPGVQSGQIVQPARIEVAEANQTTMQVQRASIEAWHERQFDALRDDAYRSVKCIPMDKRAIWVEYFGATWQIVPGEHYISSNAAAYKNNVRDWPMRRELADDYLARQTVNIIFDAGSQQILSKLICDSGSSRQLREAAMTLQNLSDRYAFAWQMLDRQRSFMLRGVEVRARAQRQEDASLAQMPQVKHPPLYVTAVSWGTGGATAMVDDQIVTEGQTISGARVTKISKYAIEFDKAGQRQVVKLVDMPQ
jgi:hypothetical protein